MRTTWKPHEKSGRLTQRGDLPDSVYAFPKQRKEPLTDARHVRNAIARFDQVTGVPDSARALAFANIKKAAKHFGVDMTETSRSELAPKPQRGRHAAAKRATATRKRKDGARRGAKRKKAAPIRRVKTSKGTRRAASTRR